MAGAMMDGDDEVMMCRNQTNLETESKQGWAPLAEEGTPGGGKDQDATGQPPKPKLFGKHSDPTIDSILKVGRHDRFIDDLTGQALPADLCMEARAKELEYFRDK